VSAPNKPAHIGKKKKKKNWENENLFYFLFFFSFYFFFSFHLNNTAREFRRREYKISKHFQMPLHLSQKTQVDDIAISLSHRRYIPARGGD
jgi:hypothetical protein